MEIFNLLRISILVCWIAPEIHSVKLRYPKIDIESWMTADSTTRSWEVHNLTALLESGEVSVIRKGFQLTYVISQHLDRIRMTCSAPYPVSWVPEEDEETHLAELHYHGMYDTRIALNLRDSKTFSYKSTIELYSTATPTRNYTCQSLSIPAIQRSAYIYWEGNSYLVYGGETIDVRSKDNLTIVLPCRVSKPEVTVGLYKESDDVNGYTEIFQNSSVIFTPQIGFTLTLKELSSAALYGRYKCVSGDDILSDDVDSVRLNVLRGVRPVQPKPVFNQTMTGNASFSFDPITRKMTCCSSSGKSPNLRFAFCHNQVTCKQKERFLFKLSNINRNVWMANGSCSSYEIYARESGVLRCRGDGIDIFRNYYAGVREVNGTFPLYFSVHEIDADQLVSVVPSYQNEIYEHLNFTVYCDTADYYFSHGLHWAVKYKNNSLHFLDASDPNQMLLYGRGSSVLGPSDFHTIRLTADLEMYSVTCYAPIWNSSHWIRKEFLLNVEEAVIPSIELIENVHWKLNDTGRNISCGVHAKPAAFTRWRKNNTTVIGDVNIRVRQEDNTSVISFHTVSHSTQGEYKCISSNVAGMTVKTVYVYIEEPVVPSSAGTILLIVTLGCLTFLTAIGALIWKLKLQKRIIDHLAGVVFRDVEIGK